MEIKQYSDIGIGVVERHHALILGISINNSYFKEENLTKLIMWARECRPCTAYVMIPDEPSVHTMVACGKSQEAAERIARLKSNALENKCRSIAEKVGILELRILRWDVIRHDVHYCLALAQLKESYRKSLWFREAAQAATRAVLASAGVESPSDSILDEGVMFLLKELAFICVSNRVLGEKETAYVYHKTMPILKSLFERRFAWEPDPGVGFITLE